MKEDGESTNNNTNGKHTQRRGMSTTGYWSIIKANNLKEDQWEQKWHKTTVPPYQQHYHEQNTQLHARRKNGYTTSRRVCFILSW